jgi:hypothetical protein
LQVSYDVEDERRLAAVLQRQRLVEEALAKEKNKSPDAAARGKIEQAEREATLREEEEEVCAPELHVLVRYFEQVRIYVSQMRGPTRQGVQVVRNR